MIVLEDIISTAVHPMATLSFQQRSYEDISNESLEVRVRSEVSAQKTPNCRLIRFLFRSNCLNSTGHSMCSRLIQALTIPAPKIKFFLELLPSSSLVITPSPKALILTRLRQLGKLWTSYSWDALSRCALSLKSTLRSAASLITCLTDLQLKIWRLTDPYCSKTSGTPLATSS